MCPTNTCDVSSAESQYAISKYFTSCVCNRCVQQYPKHGPPLFSSERLHLFFQPIFRVKLCHARMHVKHALRVRTLVHIKNDVERFQELMFLYVL